MTEGQRKYVEQRTAELKAALQPYIGKTIVDEAMLLEVRQQLDHTLGQLLRSGDPDVQVVDVRAGDEPQTIKFTLLGKRSVMEKLNGGPIQMTPEEYVAKFPDETEIHDDGSFLHDMACVECGDRTSIDITATSPVRLFDDGTDADEAEFHDTEWSDESPARCATCNHHGTVKDFTIKGLDAHLESLEEAEEEDDEDNEAGT